MVRNERCPLCGAETDSVLQLRFNAKMRLPAEPEIRHCAYDNFLFVASGCQADYDEYYESLANDTYHTELSEGSLRSPIAELQLGHLSNALGGYLDQARGVFDFGCGEASLLVELATKFPASSFVGFDPGPAAQVGMEKAMKLGLKNVKIADRKASVSHGPYELVIASHVFEHLIDFDLLQLLGSLLVEGGLLYVEVPNSLRYEMQERQEFLYYFDRLHLNHFTPQSLARLAAAYGFGYVKHFEYAFPYRGGGEYPALGAVFRRGEPAQAISSPSLLESARRYIAQEKVKARALADQFDACEGVLVWGAGDNFYRSSENSGPLSALRNMVILDRRPQRILLGNRHYHTLDPREGIQRYPWPIVVTVSEGRKAIGEQIQKIDPHRRIFFA